MKTGFAYIWEYHVRIDAIDAFEALYGPDGRWVELFRQAPGYLDTVLQQDVRVNRRFVTIDYWRSKSARDHCREGFAAEWAAIDQAGAALTESEALIGEFTFVASR